MRRLREEKDHDAIAAASHDPDAQRRLEDEPETHGARHDCTMFALVRSDRARR